MKLICWLFGHQNLPTTQWGPEPFEPNREYCNVICNRCGERDLEYRPPPSGDKDNG